MICFLPLKITKDNYLRQPSSQIVLACEYIYVKRDRCDRCDHEVSSALEEKERECPPTHKFIEIAQDAHDTKLFVFLLQAATVTPVFFSFFFYFFFLHHAYDSRELTV